MICKLIEVMELIIMVNESNDELMEHNAIWP